MVCVWGLGLGFLSFVTAHANASLSPKAESPESEAFDLLQHRTDVPRLPQQDLIPEHL